MATKADPPDYEFKDEIPDSLKCLICLQVSIEPQQHGKCGKLFCKSCVAKYKKSSPKGTCPNCRGAFDTFSDGKSGMEVRSLIVKCKSYKCSWNGEQSKFPAHREACQQAFISCPDCEGKMKRKTLDGHLKNSCPNRTAKCQYCGLMQPQIQAHMQECGHRLVECTSPSCKQKVLRKNLQEHLLACEFKQINCSNTGCKEKIVKKNLNEHLLVCEFKQINCSNAGCKAKIVKKNLHEHLLVCEFKQVNCSNAGCKVKIVKKNLHEHLLVCEFKQVTCSNAGCKEKILKKNQAAHKKVCPYELVPCAQAKAGCREKPIRKNVQKHQLVCGYERVKCKYSEAGCTQILLRKDIKSHENNTQLHMEISYREVRELRKHTAKLQAALIEQTERVNKLEKRLGMIDPTPSFRFKVTNYTHEESEGKTLFSPPFYTSASGYKMCVRVDTGGEGSAKGTHVSVSVYLMKGEYDDSLTWPFTAVVTIELLNHLEDKNHHKWTGTFPDHDRVTDADKASVGYGRTQFIPHTELSHNADKGCQYLMNGTLAFRITVQLPSYKPWLEN